jgi:hypothetical protein
VAFPQTVQDIKTEIQVDSAWTDITSRVRSDPGIEIKRGRSNENNNVDPSVCTLEVNNTDGRFSPRNPMSPYYGKIGRNTPIRVSVLSDRAWMPLDVNTGTIQETYASTPDGAALDILTDIDVRFEADLDSWYDPMELVGKWTASGNQRSWQLYASVTFKGLVFKTSVNGIATTVTASSIPVPNLVGHQAVRVTFDADNGASGNTTTFYTAPTLAGPWTQLGEPVITAGTTTIFNSTSLVHVGPNAANDTASATTRGKIFGAQIYNSSNVLVANPDFSIQANGTTSFADSTGKTWTMVNAAVSNRDIRFRGEVSGWPQKWDQSGSDVYTEIEAAGILRRLGQGQSPVPSSLARTISKTPNVVGYWPMEDGNEAEAIASAMPGHKSMTINGAPDLSSNSDFVASKALPVLKLAAFTGVVPNYTPTDNVQGRAYFSIPSTGIANGIVLMTVSCSGTGRTWNLKYTTGGALAVDGYDSDGNSILVSAATAFAINGRPFYASLRLFDSGANVNVSIGVIYADKTSGFFTSGGDVVAGVQIGRATKIVINPQLRADDVVAGHVSVMSDTSYSTTELRNAISAWKGETAGQRIKRICTENAIPFFQVASVDQTEAMGYQQSKTALELIRECAETDMGILFEPRDNYGLKYRPRNTLTNQNAALTSSYSANQLMSFEPVEDDDATVNDVTVVRTGGGSSRATDTTSPLSILSPPLGVGVYDTEIDVSLAEDSQTVQQAGWRLRLGTIDEARFPVIGFDMTSPSFLASAGLTYSLFSLDVGDRIVITGPPPWMPPDDVQQLAQGFTEVLSNFRRTISVNCSPASAWSVGTYGFKTISGGNQFKYSSDGSTTNATMTTTATTMSVSTPTGPKWTTEAAQFPIDLIVAGERMTATAIAAAVGNVQAFTVVRSVNGIVKTHAVGEKVTLFRPARYAL